MGFAAILFLSAPLWLGFLGWRARSRVARGLTWGLGAATALTLFMMIFLQQNCGPAQDLTYHPALCPRLPGLLVQLMTLPMILGILFLPFLTLIGLAVAAGFEIRSRRKASSSG